MIPKEKNFEDECSKYITNQLPFTPPSQQFQSSEANNILLVYEVVFYYVKNTDHL